MIYKLSNEADKDAIEKEFGIPFRYPNLYTPSPLINGFNETSISVVTMENPNDITFAIWGLMPQDFKEDWHIFQDNANTLNVKMEELESVSWMRDSFTQRRCLIIVTGFYTHLLENGNTCTHYIFQPSEKPFYLAGTYNILNDGFVCAALLVDKPDPFITNYHNISNSTPVIVTQEQADTWLNPYADRASLYSIVKKPTSIPLQAERISNEHFLKNLTSNLQIDSLFS
nr:SOS response-associated peptidase family protein [uncultured Allomuricauda sp.]